MTEEEKIIEDTIKETCEHFNIKLKTLSWFDRHLIKSAISLTRKECEKEISVLRKIIKGNDRCNFEDGIKKGRENLIEEIEKFKLPHIIYDVSAVEGILISSKDWEEFKKKSDKEIA
jgi:hypothetical protein